MQGHLRKRTHTTKAGKATTTWYVVIDLPRAANGKRRQKWHGGFATRREAEAARAKIVHEFNSGTYVEPSAITFDGWIHELWLPNMKGRVKPTTFDSYQRNLELHVLPDMGGRQLRQITPPMLNRLYADLLSSGNRKVDGGLSAKTVRYIHTIIHKALADAVDAGLAAANPAERAKPPRPRARLATEIAFWEPSELREFLEAAEGHRLEAAWRLSAMTGMRRGEVLGLRWKDVDLDAARISVRHTVSVWPTRSSSRHRRTIMHGRSTSTPAPSTNCKRIGVRQQADKDEWGADYSGSGSGVLPGGRHPDPPHAFSQAFERAHRRDRACPRSDCTTCATRTPRSPSAPVCRSRSSASVSATSLQRSR